VPWVAVGGTRLHTLSRLHLSARCCSATAGDRAAVLRVVSKAMQFWAPKATWALAACFFCPPLDSRPAPHKDAAHLSITVEAFGSGSVILPALQVKRETTIAGLKARIIGCQVLGGIRIFAGHGGKELADDLQSVRAAGVEDGATLVIVSVSDQDILSRLFEATRGDQWRRQKGWGPSSTVPLTAWQGVDCNGGGRVIALKLSSNRLQGAYRALRAAAWAAPHSLFCAGTFVVISHARMYVGAGEVAPFHSSAHKNRLD
jgi:hypothetical protein